MSKPMFWSSEVDKNDLKLEYLLFQNVGEYTLPIPIAEISGLVGQMRAHQKSNDSATIIFDTCPIFKSLKSKKSQCQFWKAFHGLTDKAIQNATYCNTDLDWITMRSRSIFTKGIICLPGEGYKSVNDSAALKPGFAGKILLQIPVQNGFRGANLCLTNHSGAIANLDLSKNSSMNAHLTLLMHQSSSSLLHFEITPPSSGAVIMLVFNLVWLDSLQMSASHSTLPSFLDLTSQFITKINQAKANAANLSDNTCCLYYVKLPGASTLECFDLNSPKGETSDIIFALTSLKHYEIVGVVVGAKTASSVSISKIFNAGNTKLTPEDWAGSTLQVTHITTERSLEVIEGENEEFGALIVPRKEWLLKCCSEDFFRVIRTIQERLQAKNEAGVTSDQLNKAGVNFAQLSYDLNVVVDNVTDRWHYPVNQSVINDASALLDLLFQFRFRGICVTVLQSIQAELLLLIQNERLTTNSLTAFETAIHFLSTHCSRIGRSDIFEPIQQLVGGIQQTEMYESLLNGLRSYASTPLKEKHLYAAEEIDDMLDSLSKIAIHSNASRSSKKLTEIGEFFVQFHPKALATVLVNFKTKHLPIDKLYPDMYDELFRRVSHLEYEPFREDETFLDRVAKHYSKTKDIAAFVRVFVRTTWAKTMSDARLDVFFNFFMSRIECWSDMKMFYDAMESMPRGYLVLDSVFNKFLGKQDYQPKETGQAMKNAKPKVTTTGIPSLARFFAFLMHCRIESHVMPAITRYCREMIGVISQQKLQKILVLLLKWDADKRKKNKSGSGGGNRDSMMQLNMTGIYSKIGDCLAWKADSVLSETVIAEIITEVNTIKKGFIKKSYTKVLQGIIESSLAFGREPLQKPLIKEKLVDEMLEIWINLVDPIKPSRENIVSCIAAFLKARKLSLHIPKTSSKAQELHKMANSLELDNFATLFAKVLDIEVDPARPILKAVDSLSWRLYVSMCARAIASPDLAAYLKTCGLEKAGHLYGFTLWIANTHLLDRLNEEIISLPPSDSGISLREALPDWPTVKRLAVDTCSKEALKQLTEKRQNDLLENQADEEKLEKRKLPEDPYPLSEDNLVEKEQAIRAGVPDAEEPLIKKIKIEPTF